MWIIPDGVDLFLSRRLFVHIFKVLERNQLSTSLCCHGNRLMCKKKKKTGARSSAHPEDASSAVTEIAGFYFWYCLCCLWTFTQQKHNRGNVTWPGDMLRQQADSFMMNQHISTDAHRCAAANLTHWCSASGFLLCSVSSWAPAHVCGSWASGTDGKQRQHTEQRQRNASTLFICVSKWDESDL